MNDLPKKWYSESVHPEIREYIISLETKALKWDALRYRWWGVDGNSTHIGGANAWENDPGTPEIIKLTIDEFRYAIREKSIDELVEDVKNIRYDI